MFKPNKTTASPVNTLILQILTISCVYFMCLNGCLFIWLTVSDNIFNENCICVCQDGTRHSFTLCFILCLLGVTISAVVVMKYSEYFTKMYTNGTFVRFYSWSSWKLNMLWLDCNSVSMYISWIQKLYMSWIQKFISFAWLFCGTGILCLHL